MNQVLVNWCFPLNTRRLEAELRLLPPARLKPDTSSADKQSSGWSRMGLGVTFGRYDRLAGDKVMKHKALWHMYLAALMLSMAAPAKAQIFSWRDANGNLVLSNKRPGSVLRTYAVPEAESVRVTRPAAAGSNHLYEELIAEHARLNGVRRDLVRAVVHVESGFNPVARSPKGALGLMQLMPATMRQFGVTNPFNAAENIRAGVSYLRLLLDRYGDNEELALAAYNAGPGAIDRYGQTVPPYHETKDYVARVNQMAGRPVQARGRQIYKTVEIVDGRLVTRYTDQKPATGSYETVTR